MAEDKKSTKLFDDISGQIVPLLLGLTAFSFFLSQVVDFIHNTFNINYQHAYEFIPFAYFLGPVLVFMLFRWFGGKHKFDENKNRVIIGRAGFFYIVFTAIGYYYGYHPSKGSNPGCFVLVYYSLSLVVMLLVVIWKWKKIFKSIPKNNFAAKENRAEYIVLGSALILLLTFYMQPWSGSKWDISKNSIDKSVYKYYDKTDTVKRALRECRKIELSLIVFDKYLLLHDSSSEQRLTKCYVQWTQDGTKLQRVRQRIKNLTDSSGALKNQIGDAPQKGIKNGNQKKQADSRKTLLGKISVSLKKIVEDSNKIAKTYNSERDTINKLNAKDTALLRNYFTFFHDSITFSIFTPKSKDTSSTLINLGVNLGKLQLPDKKWVKSFIDSTQNKKNSYSEKIIFAYYHVEGIINMLNTYQRWLDIQEKKKLSHLINIIQYCGIVALLTFIFLLLTLWFDIALRIDLLDEPPAGKHGDNKAAGDTEYSELTINTTSHSLPDKNNEAREKGFSELTTVKTYLVIAIVMILPIFKSVTEDTISLDKPFGVSPSSLQDNSTPTQADPSSGPPSSNRHDTDITTKINKMEKDLILLHKIDSTHLYR